MSEEDQKPESSKMSNAILEWVKVLGPIVLSWPMVALLVVILFKAPLLKLLDRFTESTGSKAEIGPLKIELGTPVLPPQYRAKTIERAQENIDLSSEIGEIRDTGPEGTTVGFAVAYALQAAVKAKTGQSVTLSPRGIYVLAKKYDEWSGEDYEGTSVIGGLKAVREVGAYLDDDWPYANKSKPKAGRKPSYKISAYSELKGIEQILNALRENKLVIATIQVTDDFDKTDKDGRVTIKLPLRTIGGKAISIVGYNAETAEFKFANDWGAAWGAKGFGVVKDTDLTRILQNAYVVDL
jgi:hypothetical protein